MARHAFDRRKIRRKRQVDKNANKKKKEQAANYFRSLLFSLSKAVLLRALRNRSIHQFRNLPGFF